jgi:hypothetical protein
MRFLLDSSPLSPYLIDLSKESDSGSIDSICRNADFIAC